MNRPCHRVVVTGIGAISPLGGSMIETWNNLFNINGKGNGNNDSSMGATSLKDALRMQHFNDSSSSPSKSSSTQQQQQLQKQEIEYQRELQAVSMLPCGVAAPVRPLWMNKSGVILRPTGMTRATKLAMIAADEAMRNSGLDIWLGSRFHDDDDNDDDDNDKNDNDECQNEYIRRRESTIVSIATGMSSVRDILNAGDIIYDQQRRRRKTKLSPRFVPSILPNAASYEISSRYGILGSTLTHGEACSASAHSIGNALRSIRHGYTDVAVVGGTESCIDALSIAGFCRLRALSSHMSLSSSSSSSSSANFVDNDGNNPRLASRPFHPERDGFVVGEGAAVLVIESLEHALARGLKGRNRNNGNDYLNNSNNNTSSSILCELVGYGSSSDALPNPVSPDPMGRGVSRAMINALIDTSIEGSSIVSPSDIDYVNAHATSTPMGDGAEAYGISEALLRGTSGSIYGKTTANNNNTSNNHHKTNMEKWMMEESQNRTKDLWVSSTKGATGHLLGAAGAIEAAISAISVTTSRFPPTWNLKKENVTGGDNNGNSGGGDGGGNGENLGFCHVTEDDVVTIDNVTGVDGDENNNNKKEVTTCMSNSLGFGGTNASLVFRTYTDDD